MLVSRQRKQIYLPHFVVEDASVLTTRLPSFSSAVETEVLEPYKTRWLLNSLAVSGMLTTLNLAGLHSNVMSSSLSLSCSSQPVPRISDRTCTKKTFWNQFGHSLITKLSHLWHLTDNSWKRHVRYISILQWNVVCCQLWQCCSAIVWWMRLQTDFFPYLYFVEKNSCLQTHSLHLFSAFHESKNPKLIVKIM